jgi:hypothetical protein
LGKLKTFEITVIEPGGKNDVRVYNVELNLVATL